MFSSYTQTITACNLRPSSSAHYYTRPRLPPAHTQSPMKLLHTHSSSSACSHLHIQVPNAGQPPKHPQGTPRAINLSMNEDTHIKAHTLLMPQWGDYYNYSTKLGNNKKILSLKDTTIVAPRCNVERQYMYKTTRCNKLTTIILQATPLLISLHMAGHSCCMSCVGCTCR